MKAFKLIIVSLLLGGSLLMHSFVSNLTSCKVKYPSIRNIHQEPPLDFQEPKDTLYDKYNILRNSSIISFEVCNSTNLPYLKLPHDFSQLSKDFCKSLKDWFTENWKNKEKFDL